MNYRTVSGDTWDSIAKAVYGSELYADRLMEANPKLLEIYQFPAGVDLVTPVLEEVRDGMLPPWKYEA